jgi:hypothetical protein
MHITPVISYFTIKFQSMTLLTLIGPGEGPVANKINEYRKIDQNTFAFILTGVYNNNSELIIHIIDQERGIAIFEKSSQGQTECFFVND